MKKNDQREKKKKKEKKEKHTADGKKGKHDISALHKKVVNLATSPTFNPYDPKKGKWMG